MKIGVLADTHSKPVPKEVLAAFKDVDFIIHAGDLCAQEDLNALKKIKEVKAVFGNMDDMNLRGKLPEKEIIRVEGVAIGLCHGEGPAKRVLDFVRANFAKDKVQVVIFGHSHQPCEELIDGILYFNPGSPNDTITAPYCSYGILEITAGKIKHKIVKVGDPNG